MTASGRAATVRRRCRPHSRSAGPRSAPPAPISCSSAGRPNAGPVDPPRYIAPLHVHREDDEAWYVLSALGVRLDGTDHVVPAGGAIIAPRGTVHTYWNASTQPTEYVLVMTRRIERLIAALHAMSDHGEIRDGRRVRRALQRADRLAGELLHRRALHREPIPDPGVGDDQPPAQRPALPLGLDLRPAAARCACAASGCRRRNPGPQTSISSWRWVISRPRLRTSARSRSNSIGVRWDAPPSRRTVCAARCDLEPVGGGSSGLAPGARGAAPPAGERRARASRRAS